MDTCLSIADDLVGDAMERSKVPLTTNLRHYLAVTLTRYLTKPVEPDGLTLRWFRIVEERRTSCEARSVADDCLVSCAFFAGRLLRQGSLQHYAGIGQDAYEAANLIEQSVSFSHMLGVLAAVQKSEARNDAVALGLLRSGARVSHTGLENVIAFRRPGPRL